jgi:hypothetical protein
MALMLVVSCGTQDAPKLFNVGTNPQNSSVAQDSTFFQIGLITKVSDSGLLDHFLELKTNLEVETPLQLKTSDVTLPVLPFSSRYERSISAEMYESLSKGRIEILDAASQRKRVLSLTPSSKRLVREDPGHLQSRLISNCDLPQVRWKSAGLGQRLSIEFERTENELRYENKNPVFDIGYWSEGFLDGSFFVSIFSEYEAQWPLRAGEVLQRLSRYSPKVITTWMASNRNTSIELIFFETEIMNRTLFFDESCE